MKERKSDQKRVEKPADKAPKAKKAPKDKKPTDKLADKTATTKFLQHIFGDAQKKTLHRLQRRVAEINRLAGKYSEMDKKELAAQTEELKKRFEKLNKLRAKYNCIRSVRGKGLLIGIEFDDTITAQGMREQLFSMGILVSAIGKSTIRLAPPLIITKAQANQFIKALDKILKNVQGPKNVFDKIKDAIPSKKQIKESAASVNNAKIDKLDQLGLTEGKDKKPAEAKDIDLIDDEE